MQQTSLSAQDPQLLRAFRAGDQKALETVYRRYSRPVERYLNALIRTRQGREQVHANLVADLVQEVFFRAFSPSARDSYDGLSDYGHYLAAIARNCYIDLLRARSREILTDPLELPFDMDTAPEPENWCDTKTLAVLESFLTTLPEGLREAYRRRFVEELSQEEAAAALGVSRRAVRTAERRLRVGLRKALALAGILPGRTARRHAVLTEPDTSRGSL